jgi:hypothetical protein
VLLIASSSRVLPNGVDVLTIKHGCGLWQGDPLSSLVIILAIDPLTQIIDITTSNGLLHKIHRRGSILRTSHHADDAVLLVAPFKDDMRNLSTILHGFGEVTGLCTNFQKSSAMPIK